MYEFWRSLFDDVLMDPQIAPFVVSFLVILIALNVAGVLGDADEPVEEDSE